MVKNKWNLNQRNTSIPRKKKGLKTKVLYGKIKVVTDSKTKRISGVKHKGKLHLTKSAWRKGTKFNFAVRLGKRKLVYYSPR